ncbi:MAG: HAD-IA family hydrolase [Candidatus Eremiobacteraeota bacterium]|nr:HAD-IA family hydrolase [Candidatus Eremiobacteraeota bacterium]
MTRERPNVNALIFDCDGVLADTERDGHLPAFNAVFAEFGLPLHWSESEYGEKLMVGGGKERLASVLTTDMLAKAGIEGAEDPAAFVAKLHAAKTETFMETVASGTIPGRPGVARIARAMHERGWRLAVASTSTEESVRAVLESVVGADFAREFAIFAGDVVPRKKPAPDIYRLAIERLGVDGSAVVVIEDSRNGLLAATAAGLRCIVTVTGYTEMEPMDEATVVVTSLGEPGGPFTEVLANRSRADIGTYVTPENLAALVSGRRSR